MSKEGISLRLDNDNEITLPSRLVASSLTLAEIGAVACYACVIASLDNGDLERHQDTIKERMGSPEMLAAIESLKAKGVIKPPVLSGNSLSLELDLDVVLPPLP